MVSHMVKYSIRMGLLLPSIFHGSQSPAEAGMHAGLSVRQVRYRVTPQLVPFAVIMFGYDMIISEHVNVM